MNRFDTADFSLIDTRIARLKLEEHDLRARIATRASTVKAEERWLLSDPLYQALSAILAGVRRALAKAERNKRKRAAPTL